MTDVSGDVPATGKSAEQGDFAFTELVPGADGGAPRPKAGEVAVDAAGYRPLALTVEIGGPGVTRIEAVLQPGAQVLGTVRAGAGRRPMADARVTLVDAAGNVVATATTGDDGAYAFADLDAGAYTVVAAGCPPPLPSAREVPPVAGVLTVADRGVDGDIELAHPGE